MPNICKGMKNEPTELKISEMSEGMDVMFVYGSDDCNT